MPNPPNARPNCSDARQACREAVFDFLNALDVSPDRIATFAGMHPQQIRRLGVEKDKGETYWTLPPPKLDRLIEATDLIGKPIDPEQKTAWEKYLKTASLYTVLICTARARDRSGWPNSPEGYDLVWKKAEELVTSSASMSFYMQPEPNPEEKESYLQQMEMIESFDQDFNWVKRKWVIGQLESEQDVSLTLTDLDEASKILRVRQSSQPRRQREVTEELQKTIRRIFGSASISLDDAEVIENLSPIIRLTPAIALAYNSRAHCYHEKGELDNAIAEYTQAIVLQPDDPDYYCDRAEAYRERGDLELAIADYTRAIELYEDWASTHHEQVSAYTDWKSANIFHKPLLLAKLHRNFIEKLNELFFSDYVNFMSDFFRSATPEGKTPLGREYVEAQFEEGRIKEKAELRLQTYLDRGIAYYEKGDLKSALTDCTKHLELSPNSHKGYLLRAEIYYHLGDYDKSIADFTSAIQLNPVLVLVDSFHRPPGAKFTSAIQLNPDLGWAYRAYCSRAAAYHAIGEYNQAMGDYTQAIQLQPDLGLAYSNRGFVYNEVGELEEAISDYDQAVSLLPDGHDKARTYRNRANTLINLGKLHEAQLDCERAERLEPDHPYTYARWGQLWYARGDYQQSLEYYLQAASLGPNPTEFNLDLALPLLCLRQPDQALPIIRARLRSHLSFWELKEALTKYKALQQRQSDLPGLEESIALLREAVNSTE